MTNDIGDIVYDAFKAATGKGTSKSEINSWINSLQYMDRLLTDGDIPSDAGVAIEYHIPQSSKRIDFILTGKDGQDRESAILIELKQWEHASLTAKDAIVSTRFKHGETETPHPSYQAWSYKCLLEDFNQTVQEEKIQLYPCAYLHNYEQDDVITNKFYGEYIQKAPVFLKPDAIKLRDFIKFHVKYGDKNQLMYRIDHGKIKPSKNLADQLVSMLKGNEEFVMIDDQKVVYETAIKLSIESSSKEKNVLIVEGGPGTGKSVVAINLLVELTKRELVAQYVTRNSAPRLVYEAMLSGAFKKTRISNMFRGSGSYYSAEVNNYDCLIIDEAHRLNSKSGIFNQGENQIKEIIRASKFSVFFIDEDQKVTLKDIGDKQEIRHFARQLKANISELKLESQFRCNGSDGYIAWLDDMLQIRETANIKLKANDFDFRIVNSPAELHNIIREKNKDKNKARLVAGYCWKWISKKNPKLKDIVIDDYKATWNLDTDGQTWIIKPDSVYEVGCIHTCQGLELDYVGVIVGYDLIVRNGKVITQPEQRASTDRSIYGWRKLIKEEPDSAKARLDAIIKNTYRTLMSRGQKGCYVYFIDDETRRYFENSLETVPLACDHENTNHKIANLIPYINALPFLDIKAAADSTYDTIDGVFSNDSSFKIVPIEGGPFQKDRFLVRAEGDSMEPRIPNGSLCLFRHDPGGSRKGKIVLCRIEGFAGDAPVAVIKLYQSARTPSPDSLGSAHKIVLSSLNPNHDPIVLTEGNEFSILGIFEKVINGM